MISAEHACSGTVLHTAVHKAKPLPLVCALIKLGADCTVVNEEGQTAAELALERDLPLHAHLLERAAQSATRRITAGTAAAPTVVCAAVARRAALVRSD